MDSAIREIEELAGGDGANAVRVVRGLFDLAVAQRASDLHIEPTEVGVKVLVRVDGVLREVGRLPCGALAYLMGRIKVLADLVTYRNDLAQEGRIRFQHDGTAADLRVSVFPTALGEKAVVRIFDPSERLKEVDQLGLAAEALGALRQALAQNDGMVLFTGPAGSGKTTTIYACLAALVPVEGGQRSIVTIEDPVEFRIPGVTQTEVNPRVGLDFGGSLSHLLRQDPEVLMVGEIRDAETASIAVEAGLTGHLVLSTMHCGDCAGAFSRLMDMGIEPYRVTSSVRLVLAQRLLRRLCRACRKESLKSPPMRGVERHFEAVGCEACMGSGFRGRIVVAEAVAMGEALRRAILKKSDREEMERVASTSRAGRSLREGALSLVAQGETTAAELGRVFGDIDGRI